MSSGAGKVVCVTGGSGFIGSWLVKTLLLRGYTINATVLNADDPREVGHLYDFEGAKERLKLFRANLMEEGSFDSAIQGCDGVFHLASPVFKEAQDPQAEIVDPAVKGTMNVLKSCAKSSSLKRLVLTSSIVAMLFRGRPKGPSNDVIDETCFVDPDFYGESKMYYHQSKTLAEKLAWEFVKENNIDMVSINPAMVLGPLLQPSINESAAIILKILNGAKTFPNRNHAWVNVRDVIEAHIKAFETPSATGRYGLVESMTHFSVIVKLLREMYPTMLLPDKCENDNSYMAAFNISTEKAKSLGIEFTPFEVGLKETVDSLIEKKFVQF